MARTVAAVMLIASASLLVTGAAFVVIDRGSYTGQDGKLLDALFLLPILASSVVGYLLASRRPGNPIGWLFAVYGMVSAFVIASDGYARHTLYAHPGALPGGQYVAWFASFADSPALFFGFFVTLFLLFPHGRLPSAFWRRSFKVIVLMLAATQALIAFREGEINAFPGVSNPFGLGIVSDLELLTIPLLIALLATILSSAVSLVRRFQIATGQERQQLKWVVYASAFVAVVFVTGPVWWSGALPDELSDVGWALLFALALASVPVAAAVAILRYRLYDIDRIINRTLVYALLTLSLGASYFGLVVGLQALLRSVNGGSDLAIALTTLVIAALFLPARRRVQILVDRRFNRRAYDAAQTVDAFSARLREQIDLDTLRYELLAVVDETMQPSRANVWLRGSR